MSNVYVAPLYMWAVFLVVLIYLGTVTYLWSYLKRIHPETWTRLGSPSLLNNSILNSFRSIGFIFGSNYKALNDEKLTALILIIRGLFAFVFITFIVGKALSNGRV
jgi:hypothetical protein